MIRRPTSRRDLLAGLTALSVLPPAGARASGGPISPWPDGTRAAVSLTYDDGLDSQLDYAVPELDGRGLKGTFFLTRENMEARLPEWIDLARRGHEVGDHTVDHPCALARFSARGFADRELDPMEGFLDANFGGGRPRTYAYPCGYLGLGGGGRRRRYARYQRLLRSQFSAARTTAGRANAPADALTDRFRLHAFEPTYEADGVHPAIAYLKDATARGAWAILVFHDVLPRWRSEGDASVATHRRILDAIAAQDLWCAPMGEVFGRLAAART
ncbi:polysaccharide deacetylase family protein [Phenylobacterium sp.]|uniref:polysaccharide deacetylase family protein n=1 Tax=Phenylobacterium sp. TaxID=1871053 RepID=UPI0025E16D6B|nr:polysaccharide deacetylase family protein [Phenylobacterium sp.]